MDALNLKDWEETVSDFSYGESIDDILLPLVGSQMTKEVLSPLVKVLTTIGIVYLFGVISSYCYSRIMLQVSQKTLNIIRKDLFNRMQDLPIKCHCGCIIYIVCQPVIAYRQIMICFHRFLLAEKKQSYPEY